MGEISDALRRARNSNRRPGPATPPPETRAGNEVMLPEPTNESQPSVEISTNASNQWVGRSMLVEPNGPIAEQYRHTAIRLSRRLKERDASIVAVTSAERGDGKTTTACNLAMAMASTAGGRRVALVEMDLRRPSHCATLDIRPEIGFESVLAGQAALADARVPTQLTDLDLFPVRDRPEDPLELLASPMTASVLKDLGRRYDTVIVDTPPALAVSDVPLLMPSLHAVLFVVTAGTSRRGPVEAALRAIGHDKVIGVFVNRSQDAGEKKYYRYEYKTDDAGEREDGA